MPHWRLPASNPLGYPQTRFVPGMQTPVQHASSLMHCEPSSSHVPGSGGVPKQLPPLHNPLSQWLSWVQNVPAVSFGGKATFA